MRFLESSLPTFVSFRITILDLSVPPQIHPFLIPLILNNFLFLCYRLTFHGTLSAIYSAIMFFSPL